MNIEQTRLNEWAKAARGIHADAQAVRFALLPKEIRKQEAADRNDKALTGAWRLYRELIAEGADEPAGVPVRPLDLNRLALMDTVANRAHLRALWEAVDRAEEVDEERGSYPDELAPVLRHYAQKVQAEIHGTTTRERVG